MRWVMGRFWMMRASRVRSSVWKVSHKRPGDLSFSLTAPVSCVCTNAFGHIAAISCALYVLIDLILSGYNASDSDSDEVKDGS
ncbi:unnamed protein product [Ilex paraguariensis]|uniref:Uncharacterized protein n=1 Tax=Ilex paraguariensis TaxID=185542 RepID=A0ABC8RZS0_9AQUA